MKSAKELTELFFTELHSYNSTNFRTIAVADLSVQSPTVHKAFSSVVTRYFIFKEKHPELSEVELKVLYFKLKLDLVATYFSEYPDTSTDNLLAFQLELKKFINRNQSEAKKEGISDEERPAV